MKHLVSLFVLSLLSLLFCGSFAQTFVPLVTPFGNDTSITYQTGAFYPNGTIQPGEYMYFYTNVLSVPKGYGITVYVQSITSSEFNEQLNITLYLNHGQQADANSYDQDVEAYCISSPCYLMIERVGECSPADGNWYFSVLNTGAYNVTFELELDIDIYGGNFLFDCSSDGGLALGIILIIVFAIIGGCIFFIVVIVTLCCCGCCVCFGAAAVATTAAATYQPVPAAPAHHHHVVAAPAYGAPQSPYPQNNIQYGAR